MDRYVSDATNRFSSRTRGGHRVSCSGSVPLVLCGPQMDRNINELSCFTTPLVTCVATTVRRHPGVGRTCPGGPTFPSYCVVSRCTRSFRKSSGISLRRVTLVARRLTCPRTTSKWPMSLGTFFFPSEDSYPFFSFNIVCESSLKNKRRVIPHCT